MEEENETTVTEFILTGYSGQPATRLGLIIFFTIVYTVTVVGNGLILLLIAADAQLHNPMYFFLSNLSFLDIGYSSSSIPQCIINLLMDKPTISFALCYVQMSISVYLGMTECILLAIMAYDRYIAISSPLHYMLIMSKKFCIQLTVGTWTSGFFLVVIPIYTTPTHFCGENIIDHFMCELKGVMKLVCKQSTLNQLVNFFTGVLTLLCPFAFILFSYLRIIMAILKMHSAGGRLKAFSTCGSHLAVVVIFYGTAMVSYLRPQSKSTQKLDKLLTLFYGIVTPMLNPLIYTLRNQEVKGSLQRFMGKIGQFLNKVLQQTCQTGGPGATCGPRPCVLRPTNCPRSLHVLQPTKSSAPAPCCQDMSRQG